VQVQLVLRAGKVLRATAIDYPQGSGVDQQINSYAIPLLQQETVATQGSRVDTVSGATYTSDGYRRSLQSALDAAHRA
ncbi:MAG: FMN-binding protein, partial [Mycobacteriales bacterium]